MFSLWWPGILLFTTMWVFWCSVQNGGGPGIVNDRGMIKMI